MRASSASIGIVAMILTSGVVHAQEATFVESMAKALAEHFAEAGGAEAGDLAAMGGEPAIKEVMEEAQKEGGKALVGQLVKCGNDYGPSAIEAAKPDPKLMISTFQQLPSTLVDSAIRAAALEPQVTADLVKAFGKDALEVEVKQPGVGSVLMQKLDADGVRLGESLSTDQAIVVARRADQIKRLPPEQRKSLVDALVAMPASVVLYLDKHPQVLLQAGGVAAAIVAKDDLLGTPGDPPKRGLIERLLSELIDLLHTPLLAILAVVIAGIAAWFAVHVWGAWRSQLLRTTDRGI